MASRPPLRHDARPRAEKEPCRSWWIVPNAQFADAAHLEVERMKREKPIGAVRHTLGQIEREDHLNAGGAHRGYRLTRWRQ